MNIDDSTLGQTSAKFFMSVCSDIYFIISDCLANVKYNFVFLVAHSILLSPKTFRSYCLIYTPLTLQRRVQIF